MPGKKFGGVGGEFGGGDFLSPQYEPAKFDPDMPSTDTASETAQPVKTSEYGQREVPLVDAEKIIGAENIIGHDEIAKIFGTKWFEKNTIPPIPFPRERLEKAQKERFALVYRPNSDTNGEPLTAAKLMEYVSQQMMDNHKGFGINVQPLPTNDFFTKEVCRAGWALVAKGVDYQRPMRTFVEQTGELSEQLRQLGPANVDQALAISEYDQEWEDIQRMFYAGIAVKDLDTRMMSLAVNRDYRRSFVELFYDLQMADMTKSSAKPLWSEPELSNSPRSDGSSYLVGLRQSEHHTLTLISLLVTDERSIANLSVRT